MSIIPSTLPLSPSPRKAASTASPISSDPTASKSFASREPVDPYLDLLADPPVPRAGPVSARQQPVTASATSCPAWPHTGKDEPWGPKVEPGPNGTLRWQEDDTLGLEVKKDEPGLEPWNSEVFYLDGIPEANDFPATLRQEWTERLRVPPREFFQTLFDTDKVKPGETRVSVDRDQDGLQCLDLEIDLDCPRTGHNIGRMDRVLTFPDDSPPEAYHRLFDLDRQAQGHGIAKDLLANSIKLYDQAGIARVDLAAALSVGGYAWAKYGFKPREGRETQALFTTIGERLERFDDVPASVRTVVKRLLDKGEPKAIWAISDLDGVMVRRGDKSMPLGKALLLGTVWKGSLQLDDPEARARFDQYVHRTQTGKEVHDAK